MRTIVYFLSMALVLSSCNNSAVSTDTNTGPMLTEANTDTTAKLAKDRDTISDALFRKADALKILGESAELTDSTYSDTHGVIIFSLVYKALKKDAKSGKTGNIYYMLEQYDTLEAAERTYDFIRTANKDHGIRDLEGVGEEAYFHSDNTNFYFILARKGNRMIRMKVNKTTGNTSLDEFNRIAARIAGQL
jgi:hypothetical protein